MKLWLTSFVRTGYPSAQWRKEGFRVLMKIHDSHYEVPSCIHFSNSITPDLYASTKGKVAQLLSKVKCFADTTDLWSSKGLKPYLGYTVHFINEEKKIQSIAMSTSFLPEDHSADNIADALKETLEEWKSGPAPPYFKWSSWLHE